MRKSFSREKKIENKVDNRFREFKNFTVL